MFVALWFAAAVTTVCLEVDGSLSPVICKAPSSRLDARREVCECPTGRRTEAAPLGRSLPRITGP